MHNEETEAEEKRDTFSAGLDYLSTLQAALSNPDKSGHLGAWAALQRPEALSDIADAWVADESAVSGMLAVIEMLPGQVTRARALRAALKRLVTERRRASLDRVIGVVQDNTLISLGIALGAGSPPASLIEPSLLDDLRVPRGYAVDPTGVFKLSVQADGNANSTRVATAPIFIAGRTHDVLTGTAKRLLMWRTPAGWTVRPIDRGVLMNSQKLIGLADIEVPVTSNTSGMVVEWLAEFEAENMHRFNASQAASRMGWIRQGGVHGFLLPDVFYTTGQTDEGGVELSTQPGLESILEGWKPSGTWEGWLEAAEVMRPFTPMWLALYASCAAPMLEILGSPSFIVDFNGETSSGKTTAMRVAASVWGRPADNMPTAMYSWDATKVFIERLCGFLCHLPVILDETKRAKDTKTVRDVVYDFANGQGRGRGSPDGTRQTASWRSVMLTSGESAATSFSQDGGTRARVLSITGKPMGIGMKEGGAAAEKLTAMLQEHYGHLGRRLMHYLVSVADQHEALREVWRETRDQYAAVARTAVSRRHAGNLATLHLASTIVHESLGVPYPEEDPMGFALEAVMRIETEKDRPHAAFIELIGWCAANQNRFWGRHEADREGTARVPGKGWAGSWDSRDDWSMVSIMPHVIREVLEPIGYQAEEVLDRWAERGWLVNAELTRSGKTAKSRTTVVRIHGAPMRVYQFPRSMVDAHVADDEVVRGDGD